MDQMDSIAVRIRIAMARENVSARELATRTNLSESTIYKASKEENDLPSEPFSCSAAYSSSGCT